MQDNVPQRTWADGGRDLVSRRGRPAAVGRPVDHRLHGPIDLRWDASTYYVLGTSLAEGKGYRLLNEPGEIEAVQYPPLLPVLVAAHQRALGTADFQAVGARLRADLLLRVRRLSAGCLCPGAVLLEPSLALVATQARASRFTAYLYPSDSLYAEIPFALRAMLFLLCLRSREAGRARRERLARCHRVPPAHGGLALLAVWVADSLVRRRFGQAAVRAAMAALPVLAWQAHVARVTGGAEYHRPPTPTSARPTTTPTSPTARTAGW